jgi:hypothetical protein
MVAARARAIQSGWITVNIVVGENSCAGGR